MTKNVGGIDRILRLIVGIALLVWGFVLSDPINWWGAIGIVPLFTALINWCPIYPLIGMNTNK
ncbi:hypothetical protein QQ73_19610 [Candidatus Endoriftia persephone str. Guaymas]|jgi:hypothetical protein|uniref:Inner membrane protein YgaP-like transmembrane domain-containing protein n=4 Tax=Gammaproteobacteria TaxID=1236 RepID=G2FHV0_9GAMM|nr:DUF2892 domain-containing protein [Candidatus Endoriftia persephone]MBA1333166.1 hypothetical protein [Candidatus Endoriftia persephone str. Guaymas]EGV51789.1 hypothetical protein Rifp1Sym_ay00100 [endosymbiont of Riftia pachyptila (vent Ph05)]EGW53629.1 hypothetical protein TevJSym_ax00270 [endosymbiont of Tevnia jerichonana (vent Tica)]KRT53658.1 Protein of unknown function (DUF2892) [endosymbiont of Ridgeia piscesae]KRT56998.1 Protein of unknown function (DUF2892) [endosymbiont of Ridge